MSNPNSGHFKGTTGTHITSSRFINSSNRDIINTSGDDLREHPTKHKQPGSKELKHLRSIAKDRTITKSEYKVLTWSKRLATRRNKAITDFWNEERHRIKKGLPTTRNWSAQQRADILNKNA